MKRGLNSSSQGNNRPKTAFIVDAFAFAFIADYLLCEEIIFVPNEKLYHVVKSSWIDNLVKKMSWYKNSIITKYLRQGVIYDDISD